LGDQGGGTDGRPLLGFHGIYKTRKSKRVGEWGISHKSSKCHLLQTVRPWSDVPSLTKRVTAKRSLRHSQFLGEVALFRHIHSNYIAFCAKSVITGSEKKKRYVVKSENKVRDMLVDVNQRLDPQSLTARTSLISLSFLVNE
jgi:hypothetical protein